MPLARVRKMLIDTEKEITKEKNYKIENILERNNKKEKHYTLKLLIEKFKENCQELKMRKKRQK